MHPQEDSFVAQTNGNYIALFSSQKPYRMNKRKRYEGHKVTKFCACIRFTTWLIPYMPFHAVFFPQYSICFSFLTLTIQIIKSDLWHSFWFRWKVMQRNASGLQTEPYWQQEALQAVRTSMSFRVHAACSPSMLISKPVCVCLTTLWYLLQLPLVTGEGRSRYGADSITSAWLPFAEEINFPRLCILKNNPLELSSKHNARWVYEHVRMSLEAWNLDLHLDFFKAALWQYLIKSHIKPNYHKNAQLHILFLLPSGHNLLVCQCFSEMTE